MNLLREYIRRKLIEQSSGGGLLIVVDIQPEYESGATFDIGDMLRAAAEYDEVLFLYNGADTLGMIDEASLKNYYFEKLDYDEEVFEELISVSEFFDKGYGFFRDVMDSDICFDRNSVIKIVNYMVDNDVQDIRDLEEEDIEAVGVNELLFDDLEDYGFWVPELQDVLPRWDGSDIAGGARNECLAEVEILAAAQGLSFNQVDQFIYEGDDRYTESVLTESMLFEGRYEAETTQISRAVVNWVKGIFAKGLPQDEVPKYKRGYPYHDIGIRMFDVPPSLKDQLNRLTATVKVDPDLGVMQDTFEVAGKAGTSMQGTKDLQVQIYLRSDFTLQDMNDFIADLKETIIHELEHTGQSEELKDTAEPHDGRGYDWNKLDGLRNYYSSQSEMEAYAKGAFKKAKVKGITYPEAIDDHINSTMETFIRRFKKFEDAGVTNRLDYNEQDLRDYFQVELRDQILDIARLKYPKAHGLNESNVLAMGMCFPFAAKKAEEWFDDHFTKGRPGRAPKRHPDLNNMDKFKVVHGKVTDKWKSPPKPIVHAWVEMGDLVFDDQTRHTKPDGIPKDVYYDMYQPEVVAEYTAEEAVNNCIMKGEGPWDEGLADTMKQRDAWMKR